MDRRRALLLLIGIFILGNLLCALAPSYWLLMGGRVVTAFCHGSFFGLGAVVAAELAAPQKKARAIALMFSGLTLANVLGVPFGTALGQAFGWRATFWVVVSIGLVAATALIAWLPRNMRSQGPGLLAEARTLGSGQVVLAMLISVISSASLFSVFTYITPILEHFTGVAAHNVTLILILYGAGLTLGNFVGGRLGDWRLMPAVIGILVLLIAVLAAFAEAGRDVWAASANIFGRFRADLALADACGERGVSGAEPRLNPQSGRLQFRQRDGGLGRRVGALTHGIGYGEIPWIGAGLATFALALVLSYVLERRAQVTRAVTRGREVHTQRSLRDKATNCAIYQ